MMTETRRSLLMFAVTALGAAALASAAHAQVYYERAPRRRRRRRFEDDDDEFDDEPFVGRCQPMCAQDTSPCDPPAQKAADGRCSSPTAGSLR
ncbi:MAG: hypothetical protein KDJ25_05400 [Rhodoblastus sp.]|nr:hypothetical protein [Rhodoblastus sp.]